MYITNIDELVCDFEKRSNHVIHKFSMCDSFTLKHIFSTYCENFMDVNYITLRNLIIISNLYISIMLCLIWEIVLYDDYRR